MFLLRVSGRNPGPLALLPRPKIQVQTFYNIRHLVSETAQAWLKLPPPMSTVHSGLRNYINFIELHKNVVQEWTLPSRFTKKRTCCSAVNSRPLVQGLLGHQACLPSVTSHWGPLGLTPEATLRPYHCDVAIFLKREKNTNVMLTELF